MAVAAILKQKGHDVVTASGSITVKEVASTLSQRRIGALVILDDAGSIAGIVSERDIVNALAESGPAVLDQPASSIMVRDVVTCTPEDTVARLMEIMTERRIRHLPVLNGNALDGIVSIGDVVKMRIAEAELEAEEMKRYIVS
jgi:CBS domain-containing protein